MKKVKNILLAVMLILFIPFAYTESAFAQSIGEIEYEEDFDFDQMFDTYENGKLIDSTEVSLENLKEEISDSNIEDISGSLLGLIGGASALAFAGIYITAIIISLATYIYSAITLKKVADKLGHPKSWFAWVPILNLVLKFQLGEQNPWLLLLGLIPIVGSVVIMVLTVMVTIKICEKSGHEKLLGLLTLIPIGAIVLWGILAWGKVEPANKQVTK